MIIAGLSRAREIDKLSIEKIGYGNFILMENAGIRIVEEFVKNIFIKNKNVLCVAGKGNNGGDALVIARQLFSFFNVNAKILLIENEGSEAFNFNLNICKNIGMEIIFFKDTPEIEEVINQSEIIFDGIAGTGIKGELRNEYKSIIKFINNSVAKVVSIDIPSGVGETYCPNMAAIKADITMCVGFAKRCLYRPAVRPLCGEIKIIKIGFPEDILSDNTLEKDGQDWRLVDETIIKEIMPILERNTYKNKRGHLAVFAGKKGMTGAASLSAQAATHTSAGLVTLFVDQDIYSIMATREGASVMVKPVDNMDSKVFNNYDSVVVGPGWGCEKADLLTKIIKTAKKGVLDADALNILSKKREYPNFNAEWIITPHFGEFKRLFPDFNVEANPYNAVSKAARSINAVVVLKGAVTFIASPNGQGYIVDGQYPKLATAGSGDLLCGIIGGYLATLHNPLSAAVLGCLVHLRAGRKCGIDRDWFNAEDILPFV